MCSDGNVVAALTLFQGLAKVLLALSLTCDRRVTVLGPACATRPKSGTQPSQAEKQQEGTHGFPWKCGMESRHNSATHDKPMHGGH